MIKIVEKQLNELKPYENNPRINDGAVEYVANSIKEFGFKVPIVIDKDNVIIAGHTRYKASKQLGIKSVPCIIADDLSEEQVKAFRLADNKVSEQSDWDYDLLNIELSGISDIDMGRFDFNVDLEDEEDIDIEEDVVPEVPETAKSKLGEIYQLGEHRLMCGDSTNAEDVHKLMNGEVADLIVTDPPYNVNVENSQGMKIANDNMENNNFKEFLNQAFKNMHDYLKNGGAFYVWMSSTEHINFETALNNSNLFVRQELIWNKNAFVMSRQDYHWKHESCLYGWKDGKAHYFIDDRKQSTVFEDKKPDIKKMKKDEMIKLLEEIYSDKISTTVLSEDRPTFNELHPTMKPLKLIARQVKNSSKQNELVLDLFGGSGSTLITCEQLNRKCYMMEYDPSYVDVIIERWEKFTGKEAIKL